MLVAAAICDLFRAWRKSTFVYVHTMKLLFEKKTVAHQRTLLLASMVKVCNKLYALQISFDNRRKRVLLGMICPC